MNSFLLVHLILHCGVWVCDYTNSARSSVSNLDRGSYVYALHAGSCNDHWYSCLHGCGPRAASTNGYHSHRPFYSL